MPVSVADTRFMCGSFAGIKRRAAAGAALNAFDYKLIRKRSFHGWQLEFPGAKDSGPETKSAVLCRASQNERGCRIRLVGALGLLGWHSKRQGRPVT
jgi:hypothetical protein